MVAGVRAVLEREQQGVEVDVLAIQVGLRSVQRRGDDMLGSAVHAGSVPGEAECQLDPAGGRSDVSDDLLGTGDEGQFGDPEALREEAQEQAALGGAWPRRWRIADVDRHPG